MIRLARCLLWPFVYLPLLFGAPLLWAGSELIRLDDRLRQRQHLKKTRSTVEGGE